MKTTIIPIGVFLFILLILPLNSQAQRNSPVVGDVAHLIDLLKKDYSSISRERQREELNEDQLQVITYFKSYLTDSERGSIKTDLTAVHNKYKIYTQKRTLLDAYAGYTYRPQNAPETADLAKDIGQAKEAANTAEMQYFIAQFTANIEELKEIQTIYRQDNAFLDSVVEKFIKKYNSYNTFKSDQFAAVSHGSSIKKAIPFIGGDLSFEMLMDGLGRFLAQRIKDELTSHVFDKIQEWLGQSGEEDPFAEFKVILPRTTEYLKQLDASGINSFGEEIKQYIEDDLNHVLENAVDLKNTPRFQALIKKYPDVDFAFEALEIIPSISEIKNPIEYFDLLENSRNISRWKDHVSPLQHNLANTIHFTSMLAHSMMVMDNGEAKFAGTDFLTSYIGEEEFMRMYLGFLYQQNRKYYDIHFLLNGKEAKANGAELATPTEFGLRSALKGFMSKYNTARSNMYDVKDDFKFFKEIILELGQKGETVYAQATEIRRLNKLGEKVEPAIVHNFIDGLLEMTEHAAYACDTTINYLFSKADLFSKVFTVSQENKTLAQEQKIATRGDEFIYYRLNLVEKTESFLGIASTCNDAWMDIVDKKYALGVLKLIEVSGQVAQPYNESSIFIEVQDLVDEIAKLAGMEGSTNWYSLVKFLNAAYKKPKVKVSDDIKVAAAEILRNYNQIIVFGEAENLISGIKSNLDLLRTQLVDISLGPDWTLPSDVDRAKIKNLLESTDFKNLIISYYSGIGIASLKEKIQTEMPKIKIGDKPLFTSDEATNFAKIVEKYYKAAFDFYVLTKQKDRKYKKSDMKKVHDELITWLRDYTLLLPEKLDWRINPIVIKVLHLVNDLAVAEDGEDIEEIIERFALPPGSSSIKRESIFDVSLNAYPGLIGGGELTWRNKSSYVVGTASFTAPVGLALSWGTEKGYSHGIFLPIIDIGAITRFRFDDDTTSTLLTDLRFQDVFSPGLYYSLGFRKSPISLNIGAQYGPELRMIEPDGTGNFFPSMRFGLGLTVDIPLLKLYTKPRL